MKDQDHPQIGVGDLVSITEAAARSGFSRLTVYRWVVEGRIPAFGHRRAIRVRLSDVLAPRFPERYQAFRQRAREEREREEQRERERRERELIGSRAWADDVPPPGEIPRTAEPRDGLGALRSVHRRPWFRPDEPASEE